MKTFSKIGLFVILAMFYSSCIEEPEFPVEPKLEFVEFIQNNDLTANFKIKFTDGDGNLGLDQADTAEPYKFNMYLILYHKVNGSFELFNDKDFKYRIPRLEASDRRKALEGEFDLFMPFYYEAGSDYDTIYYEAYIVDRDLNKSNVIKTREIIAPD